jgi:hypothetical protein
MILAQTDILHANASMRARKPGAGIQPLTCAVRCLLVCLKYPVRREHMSLSHCHKKINLDWLYQYVSAAYKTVRGRKHTSAQATGKALEALAPTCAPLSLFFRLRHGAFPRRRKVSFNAGCTNNTP